MSPSANPVKVTLWSLISLILIYTIFYLWLDIPIVTWAHQALPGTLWFSLSAKVSAIFTPEMWLAVGIIVGLVGYFFKTNRQQKKSFVLFCLSVVLAYLLCGVLKVLLARYRPVEFFSSGLYGFHFFAFKHDLTSSPSGVATMAFAGLYALSVIINKKVITTLLLIIAILITLARIITVDHYPSDLIFGAYLGILSVYWCQYFLDYKKIK